jgi:hypothetical protein
MRSSIISLLCMAILHLPDGSQLRVDTHAFTATRPNESAHTQRMLHPDVGSIVYAGGQKFGVVETLDQIQDAIHNCVDGGGR